QHYNKPTLYKKAAAYLYGQLNMFVKQLRIYTIDDHGKKFVEEVIYNKQGMIPGYDFIPVYQLPEQIPEEREIYIQEDKLLIPLAIGDNLIGLIDIDTMNDDIKNKINQINQMADNIALGLSHCLSRQGKVRQKKYTETIIKINNKIQSTNNLDELISLFLKTMISNIKFDRINVFIFGTDEQEIIYSKCINENGNEMEIKYLPELPDFKNNNYLLLKNTIGYWFLLKTGKRVVGAILFDNIYSLYKISEQLQNTLLIICSQLATAVDNIRLLSDLQRSAYTDKLTGLHNRRYFEEISLNYEELVPVSIIIGDVNGLKVTNDVFGHDVGDKLLKKIANILLDCCRPDDVIVRWGGDEFILLLPDTDQNGANKICKNIRKACVDESDDDMQISISLGFFTKTDIETSIDEVVKNAEDRMYQHKLLETKSFRSSLMSSLQETLIEKSHETAGHAERMARLSLEIGEKMELSENELDELELLAILHDIGKVAVSNNILTKSEPLNDSEWEQIKKHSETGYRIAQASSELSQIANYILCHHERWDGKGYPLGKKGKEIPKLSRIIAVVDAYDVMTHRRPYKKAFSKKNALEELKRCAGTQFDPEIVEIFINYINE
ncbi:MAG: HD domain-containing phosphohydrolase, partial [Halanaerobiales bacterium]